MMIYESIQWIEDIDKVLGVLPELDYIAGKSVMITGAAGLICSSIVDVLFRYNDTHDIPIHIYAAGRRMEEMSARFGNQINRDDFTFVVYDASKTNNKLDIHVDYIIHGAGNAFPDLIIKEPVETMLCNFTGIKYLLDYAKEYGVKRVLYISSSEVYGNKEGNEPYHEEEYGYIDLLNSRNSYSIGKRAAETLCASYAAEYRVEVTVVRPGHIYGPTASPHDNRVASSWAYAAARGEDIVMKSAGTQLRSYCYTMDCASAILTVLINGENRNAYNISNKNSIVSIRDLAEAFANYTGIKIVFENPSDAEVSGYNFMSNSSLNAQKLEMLGWKAIFDLKSGVKNTVDYLRE